MALGFLTNKEAREQIAGLETRVSELETEVQNGAEALTQAQADLATANESLSEAQADLANARERIAELEQENARIPDLEASAEFTQQRVSNEAARLLAASGHPEPIEGLEEKLEQKTMTRAEFNALNPAAKSEFSRTGGRING